MVRDARGRARTHGLMVAGSRAVDKNAFSGRGGRDKGIGGLFQLGSPTVPMSVRNDRDLRVRGEPPLFQRVSRHELLQELLSGEGRRDDENNQGPSRKKPCGGLVLHDGSQDCWNEKSEHANRDEIEQEHTEELQKDPRVDPTHWQCVMAAFAEIEKGGRPLDALAHGWSWEFYSGFVHDGHAPEIHVHVASFPMSVPQPPGGRTRRGGG